MFYTNLYNFAGPICIGFWGCLWLTFPFIFVPMTISALIGTLTLLIHDFRQRKKRNITKEPSIVAGIGFGFLFLQLPLTCFEMLIFAKGAGIDDDSKNHFLNLLTIYVIGLLCLLLSRIASPVLGTILEKRLLRMSGYILLLMYAYLITRWLMQ